MHSVNNNKDNTTVSLTSLKDNSVCSLWSKHLYYIRGMVHIKPKKRIIISLKKKKKILKSLASWEEKVYVVLWCLYVTLSLPLLNPSCLITFHLLYNLKKARYHQFLRFCLKQQLRKGKKHSAQWMKDRDRNSIDT